MRYRRGLPGSIRRIPRGTGQIPRSGLRMAGCRAGLGHRDLAAYPGARQLDGLARSSVSRLCHLEQMQHVLRAVGCPLGEKVVVGVLQRAAAANRDEPGVANFGKDHSLASFRSGCPTIERWMDEWNPSAHLPTSNRIGGSSFDLSPPPGDPGNRDFTWHRALLSGTGRRRGNGPPSLSIFLATRSMISPATARNPLPASSWPHPIARLAAAPRQASAASSAAISDSAHAATRP
jgi:hypothetical protein